MGGRRPPISKEAGDGLLAPMALLPEMQDDEANGQIHEPRDQVRPTVARLVVHQNLTCTPTVTVQPERSIRFTSPGSFGAKSPPMSSSAHW